MAHSPIIPPVTGEDTLNRMALTQASAVAPFYVPEEAGMTQQMAILSQPNSDEKARRQASLIVGAPVHIASTYYGREFFGLPGVLVSLNRHDLYTYNVKIDRAPGFDRPVVRSFAWYELSV